MYPMIEITFNRQKLFRELWSRPFSSVAQQYKIHSQQLDTVVAQLELPVPDARQNTQLYYRRKIERPKLPPCKITEYKLTLDRVHPNELSTYLPKGFKPLVVSNKLANPHPLVKATKHQLQKKYNSRWGGDRYKRFSPSFGGCVDVLATRQLMPRALRIFDCLIIEITRQGYQISTETYNNVSKCYTTIDGVYIYLRVQEDGKQNRTKIKDPKSTWKEYEYDYQPSGKLKLLISDSRYSIHFRTIADTKTKLLEERLDKFYPIIFEIVGRRKEENEIRRVERKKVEAIRKENERIQLEEEQELERRAELERNADLFTKSQNIYQFIEEIKNQKNTLELSSDQEKRYREWINWAEEHAGKLNSTTRVINSILNQNNN